MEKGTKVIIRNLYFSYNGKEILKEINLDFKEHFISAIVGPSGVGKSTLLLTMNRLWENIPGAKIKGIVKIKLNGEMLDIYHSSYPITQLRRQVGIVFQVPNPLPMSIYKNVAFPLKLAGEKDKEKIRAYVERALRQAYLWEEVKDRLNEDAFSLSVGQQQRLCIARALVLEPEILLLDEPTSSLDVKACSVIEELLQNLKNRLTIILVSHYLDQVRRIGDEIIELSEGKVSTIKLNRNLKNGGEVRADEV